MTYPDLKDHIQILEKENLLYRVRKEINKDTELHPLVRWQFRGGIPEKDRKAFLFENVVDSKGRKYDIPVAVGVLAANARIYAIGLGCKSEEINIRWEQAVENQIPPEKVSNGPVHDVVIKGKEIKKEGLGRLPIPISTPGFDNAPYTTAGHWITKDLETGIQNMGNYRGHVKAPDRIGVFPSGLGQDIQIHWEKAKERGEPLDAAIVIGCPPVVSYAAVQKFPYGVDELAVAGGLVDEPIRVVKCKTVDLSVPAEAEIVIEGKINTDYLEEEGPFGESHGFMHPRQYNPFMEVECITHRKDAIYVSIISQVTPSESSVIKRIGYENIFLKHLRDNVGLKSVKKVVMHEPLTNLRKMIIIQMSNPARSEVWRALASTATYHQGVGKLVVAVDEDIDPYNLDAVMWAVCYRAKFHEDAQILKGMEKGHAPPFKYSKNEIDVISHHGEANESSLLIDATLKEPFPPVSLPKKEYMERALELWNELKEELELPDIIPEGPWYGYSLGLWDEELEEEAKLAVIGEHYKTGEKLSKRRIEVQ
jgi:4-hydroxy-3-polyprenylbenzoate decarboxylase